MIGKILDDLDYDFDRFNNEMRYLGLEGHFVEGAMEIEKSPFQEELFKEKASEPLWFKTRLSNLNYYAYKGYYPFFDLVEECEIIYLGEMLNKKYPKHPYTEEIQFEFEENLNILFDFHARIGVIIF